MAELLEGVNFPQLEKELESKCPFTEPDPPDKEEEKEHAPKDDTEAASRIQHNDGGKLGENLTDASEGAANTINNLHGCGKLKKEPVKDTRTNPKLVVSVKGLDGDYPYIQAAHHLVPGVASLEKSQLYKKYMKKGGKITTTVKKRKYTIKVHIGYNVNGAHNGVWLPGNYAIRADVPGNPLKKDWGKVSNPSFKENYMLSTMRKVGGKQFHDAHSAYNTRVRSTLDKIALALIFHQDFCEEDCKTKKKIPPPFRIKKRLYALSKWLKTTVTGGPSTWKDPYYTSGPLRTAMLARRKKFLTAYSEAKP